MLQTWTAAAVNAKEGAGGRAADPRTSSPDAASSSSAAMPRGTAYPLTLRTTAIRQSLPAMRHLGGLTPSQAAAIAGWKAILRLRREIDRRGGYRRMAQAGHARAARWRAEWAEAGMFEWLTRVRPEGPLWLEAAGAPDWCRDTCTPADLELADASAHGRFDLLGSGPRELGDPPAWLTDLYTGRPWPLDSSGKITFTRGDGSDVRTVWELSRCYHFIALARAYWRTGEAKYAHTFVRHVDSWIEQNPLGRGPHWASPMDAAIRAANWSLAAVLFARAPAITTDAWQRVLSNLYATGLFLARYPEWHPVYRGNHYVADAVGLACVGALFEDDRTGGRWLDRSCRILPRELLVQVHADGVSFEGTLGYHRLVTELFDIGSRIVRRHRPRRWTPAHEARLEAMYDFVRAYLQPDGRAPMIGDADDGRLHLLDASTLRDPRRHGAMLLRDDVRPSGASGLYRDGGFAVLSHERDHCVVRCGPVGLRGAGSHDHNDQLSFELALDGRRIIRDSGTFCYTRDLAARHRFRSTAAHNALQLGGEEQNPLRLELPWRVLADRTRSEVLEWQENGDVLRFEGAHHGYAHLAGAPIVRRRIECDRRSGTWRIRDTVTGSGTHELAWRLHLDVELEEPGELEGKPPQLRLSAGGARIEVAAPDGLSAAVERVGVSDRYGALEPRPRLVLTGRVELPLTIETTIARKGTGAPPA